MIETIERLVGYALLGFAAAAACAGLFILLFRVPARATLLTNGRQRGEEQMRATMTLNGVYTNDVKPTSFKVDDALLFSTRAGTEMRVWVQRPLSRDPATLIWYAPSDPRRFTTRSPIRCFAFAVGCVVTAVWLRW